MSLINKARYERIRISDLDPHPAYPLTHGRPLGGLVDSLDRIGQITPLILWPDQGRLVTLCGGRRVAALSHLGRTDALALILPDHTDARQALLLALEDNLSTRGLNEAEKVLALNHLAGHVPQTGLLEYLPRLNIPARQPFLDRYLALRSLGTSGLDMLADDRLDPETGERLAAMGEEDLRAALSLLEKLTPGRNKRRRIVTLLEDIAHGEKTPIAQILRHPRLLEALADEKTNRPQKEQSVRKILRELRFPRLTELERKRGEAIQGLGLSSLVRFQAPDNFEGLEFHLDLVFSNLPEFERGAGEIMKLVGHRDLKKIVELG